VDLTVPAELLDREHDRARGPTAALAPVSMPSAADGASIAPRVPVQRGRQAPAVIYEQLAGNRSWFAQQADRRAAPWQESMRAAHAASAAPVTEWTRSGLPIREPGERVFPPSPAVLGQPAPVPRDPEQVRRQMRAMQTGLGQAGRRRLDN
jgi:hypothetical protein